MADLCDSCNLQYLDIWSCGYATTSNVSSLYSQTAIC